MHPQDPVIFIKKVLAIVGHSATEQESLAADFFRGILERSLMTLLPKLPPETQDEMKKLFQQGKQPKDIIEKFFGTLDPELLTEHVSAVSFTVMNAYLEEIMPNLTSEQKTSLAKIFNS